MRNDRSLSDVKKMMKELGYILITTFFYRSGRAGKGGRRGYCKMLRQSNIKVVNAFGHDWLLESDLSKMPPINKSMVHRKTTLTASKTNDLFAPKQLNKNLIGDDPLLPALQTIDYKVSSIITALRNFGLDIAE